MKSSLLFLVAILCLPLGAWAFGPCSNTYPAGVAYLPNPSECGGKAAIVLWGKYTNSFSAVARDCNNNDRDPCHTEANSCGTNQSSPFKAQKILSVKLRYSGRKYAGKVHCLKESGDSEVYKLVRRITIKVTNPVRSSADLLKLCLKSRTTATRKVKILSVQSVRVLPNYGWTSVCATQGYLNCPLAYADICPQY